ncbi:MAG: hypothetical protein ABIF77_00755 [bacterium]
MSNQSTVAVRTCRLLYYGSQGAGKRSNLQQIVASIPEENRLALATERPGRQIAFRLHTSEHGDWNVLVEAIDTGQEQFHPGHQRENLEVDGIVFLAHSAASRLDQSLSSLETLKAFLDSFGEDITSVPLVIQYNGREEPDCLPVDRLESLLNPWGLLSFPASISRGEGVKESLKAILSLTISNLVQGRAVEDTDQYVEVAPGSNPPEIDVETRKAGSESVEPVVNGLSPDLHNLQIVSEDRSGLFFEDLRPPIMVPVRIPKRLLEKFGSARIILEIEVVDSDTMFS